MSFSFSACEQIEQGVVAIIGPTRSNAVKAVNYICSGLDIPQIAFAATDHSLFLSYQQYPSLLRLSSSGDSKSDVIMAVMERFKWTKAVMITSTDDYGKINDVSCTIRSNTDQSMMYHAPFSPIQTSQ
jgi:polypeptide N-acetylgalactosaminyltransferase/glutamate receptor 2/ionotropic kainate glutamate receptor 2